VTKKVMAELLEDERSLMVY